MVEKHFYNNGKKHYEEFCEFVIEAIKKKGTITKEDIDLFKKYKAV